MISIVVPVYNSEVTLSPLCKQIALVMEENNQDYEIILINDDSKDNSGKLMKQLSDENPNIINIHLEQNYGQQNALLCGLRRSHGDHVITIDDDLQFKPKDISKLMDKMHEGYDVVYGVPKDKAHNKLRNIGSRFKEYMFRFFLKKPRNITITSFRIMKRSLVNQIILDRSSVVYLSAMTFRHTKNVSNITVEHTCRLHGQSNYSYIKLIRLMINIMIYYSNCPLFIPLRKHKPQYIIKEIN